MRGYIKLYRQIAENAIWLIKPFSEGQAWVDLLCISTFDKGFIKTKNGQIIELTVGDCGYSQLSLSERWGWSRGKVKRFILLLEKQKMIQQKKYDKLTIINILNYEKYQNRTTNDTTNNTINDTTNEQQMIQQTNTINNDKNDNNDNNDNKGINNVNINAPNPNNIFNPIVKEFNQQIKEVLKHPARLSCTQCDKVIELNQRIDDFKNTIPTVLQRLKTIQWRFDDGTYRSADVNWLLKDENYVSVLVGAYSTKEELIKNWKPKGIDNER